ncbi:LysR family transcriptional regulator [Piscinibacter sp. XHJ-5]|uniref:LysR family transcriptional regulator n=1 Tax=Piscinibacter sp. XHJ-5 TaxID=3037797 RepID=UPI002452DAF6|nr:LysR family transcriptional regulator [Piscinibacter sp. XHJ-5]
MLNQIDLARADLNLLVLFQTVLEERHVGRAAERLNLTPSAVSHGLGRLRRLLNDPLFLKTPKGVVPTDRAARLAPPIADVLARVRSVLSSAAPFDPGASTRRFTIGAPDAASAVFLPPLLAALRPVAPGIDITLRQLLPVAGEGPERAWRSAWADLEARSIDMAIVPSDEIPLRFRKQLLYEEDFVIAMRARHPFKRNPSLDRYCEAQHLVVSMTGDPHGFVDEALARHGRARRVALTVPNFMFALTTVSQTDLVCALPRRFAAMHAARFGVVTIDPPLQLSGFRLNIAVPEVALMDAGIAWLLALVQRTGPRLERAPRRRQSGMSA